MSNFFSFILERKEQILSLLIEHTFLTMLAIALAILIGIPLGILITNIKVLRKPILGLINTLQAVPSMALLGLLIPLLGIGTVPAVTTVVLYSLLPIVKNTFTALTNIDENMLEAARGMGLTKRQTLIKGKDTSIFTLNYVWSKNICSNISWVNDISCFYRSWRIRISGIYRCTNSK